MHVDELWHSNRPINVLARICLLPASALYTFGWEAYLAVYNLGLKKPKRPHPQTVCIGNLMVGGTGKSPVSRFIAQTLQKQGKSVVISCSGYGGQKSEGAEVAPEGDLNARVWGDEPAMLRWLEPDIPLIVGRDRVQAATLCHQRYPESVLVLDDGFQHLPLQKRVTILLDPPNPDNRLCLPAGPYREPRWNRARADLIIPGEFRVEAEPLQLLDPQGNPSNPKKYTVLCAIGQPQKFLDSITQSFPNSLLAAPPRLLHDHDPLDAGTLLHDLPAEIPIVVTAKDWVKLRERGDLLPHSFLIATHNVRVEPFQEFDVWLRARLVEAH
jgi:tetraacyldisaccharide 4'-kinase